MMQPWLFGMLSIALVVMALLGIFRSSLYDRLSTRIIALIFATCLVTVVMAFVMEQFMSSRIRWHMLQTAIIVIGGPVVLGLLAARFVQRPLRQFNDAVASLEQSNYKVQLQSTGILEFDEVFMKFNKLIERLRDEEKLRNDLVSDTSHELNTPLTIMVGQLTAMQEGKHALTKERVEILKEQAERLADLVQQLDVYTKARIPDADKPETIYLKACCEQLIASFAPELKQRAIHATVDVPNEYTLQANQHVLQQVLTNLIQNTLRYAKATEITIAADAEQIVFSDNGKGVPSESLKYLFERFYRVDPSRSRSSGGLGLGLAIVRELVIGQGWAIRAKNTHPGLAFYIDLHPKDGTVNKM